MTETRRTLRSSFTNYRIWLGVLAVAAVLGALAVAGVTQGSSLPPEDGTSAEQLATRDIPATSAVAESSEDEVARKLARPQVATDTSNAPCRTVADCPPPPPRSRFVTGSGFFEIPPWDDSHRSDAEKAAVPWRDPFWSAFVQCMQAGGVGVGRTTPEAATQADIDFLVAEVNKSGPSYIGTPRGFEYQPSPAGDVFRSCETILYEQRPPTSP